MKRSGWLLAEPANVSVTVGAGRFFGSMYDVSVLTIVEPNWSPVIDGSKMDRSVVKAVKGVPFMEKTFVLPM